MSGHVWDGTAWELFATARFGEECRIGKGPKSGFINCDGSVKTDKQMRSNPPGMTMFTRRAERKLEKP